MAPYGSATGVTVRFEDAEATFTRHCATQASFVCSLSQQERSITTPGRNPLMTNALDHIARQDIARLHQLFAGLVYEFDNKLSHEGNSYEFVQDTYRDSSRMTRSGTVRGEELIVRGYSGECSATSTFDDPNVSDAYFARYILLNNLNSQLQTILDTYADLYGKLVRDFVRRN